MRRRTVLVGIAASALASVLPRAGLAAETFESLLHTLQTDSALAANVIGHNELGEARLEGLETAIIRTKKSKTPISPDAIELIIASEVTSESVYVRKYQHPIWPKKASGVTCAIGYDVGYTTPEQLEEDWRDYLDASQIALLKTACGVTGFPAKQLAKDLASVTIPWDVAHSQFLTEVVPRYVGLVERSLLNTNELSQDSLGALVSLVYNRGASFQLQGDRYSEMRAIRAAMGDHTFDLIPDLIRHMVRLWGSDMSGLWTRRKAEAALFQRGLKPAE